MKAYGMPVQSYVWKQPVTTNAGGHGSLIGAFVKAEAANNLIRAAAASTSSSSSSVTAITNSRSTTTHIGKIIVRLSSSYHPVIIWYHPVTVRLLSGYRPVIVLLSSGYRPVIVR